MKNRTLPALEIVYTHDDRLLSVAMQCIGDALRVTLARPLALPVFYVFVAEMSYKLIVSVETKVTCVAEPLLILPVHRG